MLAGLIHQPLEGDLMGYTTKISDYELQRGDPVYSSSDFEDDKPEVKSKTVIPKEKKPPATTTAETKSK